MVSVGSLGAGSGLHAPLSEAPLKTQPAWSLYGQLGDHCEHLLCPMPLCWAHGQGLSRAPSLLPSKSLSLGSDLWADHHLLPWT